MESKIDGAKRLVRVEVPDDRVGMPLSDKDATIRWLINELEERNKLIEQLQEEIKHSRERSDAIIMKLTDELEAQRLIFEGRQPKGKQDKPFWRRLSKKDTQ